MESEPEIFEIVVDESAYTVEICAAGQNIYRLFSQTGSYLIAKDLYNIWVELNRKQGSAGISLSKIGRKIEEYQSLLV